MMTPFSKVRQMHSFLRAMLNETPLALNIELLAPGLTVFSWWLYSFNHNAVQPGKYYLQTWLTTIDDEQCRTREI
jgi:hypothetical protein